MQVNFSYHNFKQSSYGVLIWCEHDRIIALIEADCKVMPEELAFVRTLIREKVASGELSLDYCLVNLSEKLEYIKSKKLRTHYK
nr:MAG: hypothetical protein EDM05_20065 [Leptolyngbya sp. IPPAS B-1204]